MEGLVGGVVIVVRVFKFWYEFEVLGELIKNIEFGFYGEGYDLDFWNLIKVFGVCFWY